MTTIRSSFRPLTNFPTHIHFVSHAHQSQSLYLIPNTMSHKVLITGGSGYLGGTLLVRLPAANIIPPENVFALVRNDSQADSVKQYGATPLKFDISDEAAVRDAIVTNGITIVYFLVDPVGSTGQVNFIKALAEVKGEIGEDVHFLHVSLIRRAIIEAWVRNTD